MNTPATIYVRGVIISAFEAITDPDEAVAAAEAVFAVILREARPEKRRLVGLELVSRALDRIEAGDA